MTVNEDATNVKELIEQKEKIRRKKEHRNELTQAHT